MLAGASARFYDAVQAFWDARDRQQQKQVTAGKIDAGTRGAVTGGTQMGALETLLTDILVDAGLPRSDIRARTALELPGYYRPEKKWDLLVRPSSDTSSFSKTAPGSTPLSPALSRTSRSTRYSRAPRTPDGMRSCSSASCWSASTPQPASPSRPRTTPLS